MQMRGPPTVSAELLKQLTHRPIVGDWVAHGLYGFEPEQPVFVTLHDASLARHFAASMLYIIVSRAVRFPDVDLHSLYRLAARVFHGAYAQ
jgi:hypothetical protein